MKWNKKWMIPIVIIVLVLFTVFYQKSQHEIDIRDESQGNKPMTEPCVWIDVKGAVNKPNLYCVKKDSMIEEIVIVAGGFHFNADLSTINRASRVQSESMIIIPFTKEIEISKISINKATIEELMKIPHIGESKAKAIIEYRTKNGRFMNLNDITKVSGIGSETFTKIKDYISL
jgi:competence protein ComEA